MPEITEVTARFLRRIQLAEYEPAEAEFKVVAVFNEGEEADASDLAATMQEAMDRVNEAIAASRDTGEEKTSGKRTRTATKDDDADADAKPASRRRSRKTSGDDDADADEKPASRRRGSRASKAEADDDAPKSRSRRSKKDDDEISDRDVAKAASDAAEQLSPRAVKRVLAKWGVDDVKELDQDERREFIDLMQVKIEEAE